jgi:metal-sulfur cluster biosynthetic enzyme
MEQELWFIIRDIRDPEFPYTLSQLRVLSPTGMLYDFYSLLLSGVCIHSELSLVRIQFTPTVPHCSLSTLIGLAIRYKIETEFLVQIGWKLLIQISPGSHEQASEINRQLSDKERVSAAFENPRLIKMIESITSHRM